MDTVRKEVYWKDPSERIVRAMLVSPYEDDHQFMRRFFGRTNWILHTARSCRQAEMLLDSEPVSVIVTERELPGENWRSVLRLAAESRFRPLVVATHTFSEADILDELLAEGVYDVVAKPFVESEVSQVISFAWLRWKSKRRIESRVPVIGQEAAPAMAGAGYSGL